MNARVRELASLYADTSRERRTYGFCLAAALLLHAGTVLWLGTRTVPATLAALPATEIELAPPPPPPAAAEPPPPLPEPAPAPRPKPAARPKQPTPPPPDAPAPAPALLTAADKPANGPEPVRFASDPNGHSYSSGLVAAGAAPPRAPTPPVHRAAASGDGITPADRLDRQPSWRGDDCRGYFPDQAQVDQGQVELIAVVRADGGIARLDVASETPQGQGFARAARACVQQQRFSPALDRQGEPTTARARFSLRFSR